MGKLKRNQYGFSAIEALLIIVIVIIISSVAFYVYHATNKKANNAANQISKNAAVKLHTPDDADYFAQGTYTDYLAAVKNADTNSQPGLVGLAAVKNNLTPGFYAKAAASKNGEVFSCDGNSIPLRYQSTVASYTKTNAKIAVSIFNSEGLSNIKVIIVNVDLTRLKITAVDCN